MFFVVVCLFVCLLFVLYIWGGGGTQVRVFGGEL